MRDPNGYIYRNGPRIKALMVANLWRFLGWLDDSTCAEEMAARQIGWMLVVLLFEKFTIWLFNIAMENPL